MNENMSQSPSPTVVSKPIESFYIDFNRALEKLMEGAKITRLEWDNFNIYGFLSSDGVLNIHIDDKDKHWVLKDADIDAMDWMVV